jgi:opacity protein-like surface antigen
MKENTEMKKIVIGVLMCALIAASAAAESGFRGRSPLNNVSMPTGFTLNQGEFLIGLGPVGYGFSDRFQFSTNILLYMLQVYNGDLRYGLLKSDSLNVAAGVKFDYLNLAAAHNQTGFLSTSPYLALSSKVNDRLILHLSGQLSSFSSDVDLEDDPIWEHLRGTSLIAGLEYSVSHRSKILAEAGYDATFRGPRLAGAVLFGWETFRLKLGVTWIRLEGICDFAMPIIGLWWRFKG